MTEVLQEYVSLFVASYTTKETDNFLTVTH